MGYERADPDFCNLIVLFRLFSLVSNISENRTIIFLWEVRKWIQVCILISKLRFRGYQLRTRARRGGLVPKRPGSRSIFTGPLTSSDVTNECLRVMEGYISHIFNKYLFYFTEGHKPFRSGEFSPLLPYSQSTFAYSCICNWSRKINH